MQMLQFIINAASIVYMVTLNNGYPAEASRPERHVRSPQVSGSHVTRASTDTGPVVGTRLNVDVGIENSVSTVVDEFLGIPFAAPPVGHLRFQPPRPALPWVDPLDCTRHGRVCPQGYEGYWNITSTDKQSEDCLYLNVYTPYQHDHQDQLYPVMVFIHGGSFEYGTGNKYNGSALVQQGVVLVTFNYRLGVLGFLSSGSDDMPGNYGLMDQILALKWVQKNIVSFRGDPDAVTIFGSSAGGASVGHLMLSPLTTGLLHRVIAQSGTANAMWASHSESRSQLQGKFRMIASMQGCDARLTVAAIARCLRDIPHIVNTHGLCQTIGCTDVDPLLKPVVDGKVLTNPIKQLLQTVPSKIRHIPYMTGTVRAEFGPHYTDVELERGVRVYIEEQYGTSGSAAIMHHYTDWHHVPNPLLNKIEYMERNCSFTSVLTDLGLVAPTSEMSAYLARGGQKVYLYYFENGISYHSVELNFVFGVPYIGMDEPIDEAGVLTNFTDGDKKRSLAFMQIWAQFAKEGKLTQAAQWNPLTAVAMEYMHMTSVHEGLEMRMRNNLKADDVALWNVLVPYLSKLCQDCKMARGCDYSKTWIFFGLTVLLLITVVMLLCLIIWSQKHRQYSLLRRGSSQRSQATPINL